MQKANRPDRNLSAQPKTLSVKKNRIELDVLVISAGNRLIGQLVNQLSHEYSVEVAKSGNDALQIVRHQDPTLILLDQNLPEDLSLVTTIQTLQKYQRRLKSGFLVLRQAQIEDEIEFELMEIGVKGFLDLKRSMALAVRQVSFWYDWQNQVKRMARRNQELYGQNLHQRSELARHGELMHFLPKNVAQEVIAGTYKAETHRLRKQTVTVLFADIVSFTPLSAQLTPEILAEFLNEYLQQMTEVVVNHGGIVDKFIGDEVMAIFGAPEAQAETIQVHNAFSAALAMIEGVKVLDQKWGRHLPAKLDIRVGVNTGPCTAGVFGSKSLQSYTVIGSTVNLAARLTSAAPQGGIATCNNSLKWVKMRTKTANLGNIPLKGIVNPVEVYQVLEVMELDLIQ